MAEKSSQNWIYHQILEQKPKKVYLSLGSNLGDREVYLLQAVEQLKTETENQVLKLSSVYETEPVDCPEGDWFLNQVVYLVTLATPEQLLKKIHSIESSLGRSRNSKNAPREIDIDILFYADQIIAEPELQIPHPRLHERKFVLEPLKEINPQLWHPVFGKSVEVLLNEVRSTSQTRLFQSRPASLKV